LRPKATARFAKKKHPGRRWLRTLLWMAVALVVGLYACCALELVFLKWVDPFTTAVQAERRIDAMVQHHPYHKRYVFVPLRRISPELQHAVIAAEDERFREHAGIDWIELKKVIEKDLESGKLGRGGSTISQQLVKNLFLSTKRSMIRKGIEFTLVPMAEKILSKDRILELYLNVIEWGPGIFGAEAASEAYYKIPAAQVSREQAARLAACIPAPLKRRPALMGNYAELIQIRMRQMGW
jgi:monofunctional biosynthetic peptidoglycan transglycosylase